MAARCTNGHDTPEGDACATCGAPLAPTAPPAGFPAPGAYPPLSSYPPPTPDQQPASQPAPPAFPPPSGYPPPAPYAPSTPPPPSASGYLPPSERPVSVLAAVSLGLSLLFPIGSIPAVITGHIARHRIITRRQRGNGLALAGLILGWIGTAIMVLSLLVVFFTGSVVEKDDGADGQAAACLAEKRTLETAIEAFRADTGYYPESEDELLYAKFIRRPSTDWDIRIGTDGRPDVVASPDGDC